MCELCNKIFKQKSHYDKHILNKKIPCANENVNIEPTLTANNCNLTENKQNLTENKQNLTENKQKIPNINNEHKNSLNNLICEFCDNEFSRKDYLQLHKKKYCKNKKYIEDIDTMQSKINGKIYVSGDKYEKLQEDNQKLIEVLEEYKQFIKDNNLIKHSIPMMNSVDNSNNNTKNNTKNNTNNGSINNGVVNNNNNTTINHIVQFGKEDISKCDLVEMMNIYLKSTGGNIFPNILRYLNFNPNYPENFNILMGDLARENVKVHNGKKFITKKFKSVKGEILNSLSNHISNMCDSYIKNPKTKKSADIMSKIKINDISVKLINDDDITPLLTIKIDKKSKNNKNDQNDKDDKEKYNSDSESEEYLDSEGEKKLIHYENKRLGLQEITTRKLKEELYNNREMILKDS